MIGIKVIEEEVQFLSSNVRPNLETFNADPVYHLLPDEQLQELWLRNGIEIVFEEVLRDFLAPSDLQELKRAMFQSLYRPNFGGRVRA